MIPNACATEDNQPFSHSLPPSRGDSSDTPSPFKRIFFLYPLALEGRG